MDWFNWSDMVVAGIILLFGLIGLMKGFIRSFFKIASYLISLILAIKFYPVVSGILIKTSIYTGINNWINNNLLKQKDKLVPETLQAQEDTAGAVIENLPMPDVLKNSLSGELSELSGLIDISDVMETISTQISKLVIDIISLVILFIAIKLVLLLLRLILEGLAKLPVLKQADKLGGFVFGVIQGLLIVYAVCALLMLFNSSPQFADIFNTIENSMIAKYFYENNIILNLMFPGTG